MSSRTSSGTSTTKFTLTPKAWLILRLLVGCIALVLIGLLAAGSWFQQPLVPAVASAQNHDRVYQQIIVQPGDTLWGISSRLAQGQNQATVLEQILTYNDLENSDLEVGQTLYVPLRKDSLTGVQRHSE